MMTKFLFSSDIVNIIMERLSQMIQCWSVDSGGGGGQSSRSSFESWAISL